MKPTDQNLSYAFEGDNSGLENGYKGIAKNLVDKGILILTPIADGKKVYNAAVLAGDGAKIDNYKKEIREKGTIAKLLDEAPALAGALSLSPPLRLRYGEKVIGAGSLHAFLQSIVLNRFKHVLDFTKGLTESQLKATPQMKQAARCGIIMVVLKSSD